MFGCSFCFAIYDHLYFYRQTLYLSCDHRIQMSSIVLRLHFIVFYSGVFLSFISFIKRHACICDGHLLEEPKSLKALVTKGELGNANLDIGRIDVHSLTPRELARNLSGTCVVDSPFSLR